MNVSADKACVIRSLVSLLETRPALTGFILWVFYFVLLACVLRGSINDGFIGDGLGYMAPVTRAFSVHPLTPFMDPAPNMDTGHLLLMNYFVALYWRLFGIANWPAHLAVWIGAALGLAATHRLGSMVLGAERSDAWGFGAGFLPALLLFCHPLFLGMSAQYLSEIPSVGFFAAMTVGMLERRRFAVGFWAFWLAFTKLTGILAVAAVALVELIEWIVAERRSGWRSLVSRMVPYGVCAALLGLYIVVKVKGFGLAIRTFDVNFLWYTHWNDFRVEFSNVWKLTFEYPRWGIFIWFSLSLVAVAKEWIAMILKRGLPGQGGQGGGGREEDKLQRSLDGLARFTCVYTMVFISIILFHSLHALYDQPRYFLLLYPLMIVAGIEGLLIITRGRWWFWGPVVILWIALQTLRWHNEWLNWLEHRSAAWRWHLAMPYTQMSLSVTEDTQYYRSLVDEVCRRGGRPHILGPYETAYIFARDDAGYLKTPLPTTVHGDLKSVDDLGRVLRTVAAQGPGEILYVLSEWDVSAKENLKLVEGYTGGVLLKRYTLKNGGWGRLYLLRPPG